MNTCPRRYLLALAVMGWASSQCPAKESSVSLPPKPGERYGQSEALAELAVWGAPVSASEPRGELMNWLFHQCFGGARADAAWMGHPRTCQALWLALATHGVASREATAEDFRLALEHFAEQKALDGKTVAFFSTLWDEPAGVAMQESAADFLGDWLGAFEMPALSAGEQNAIDQAVKAGVLTLRFAKVAAAVKK
jgi:hypothetical protein